MEQEYTAMAATTIHADTDRVWKALTDPEEIKQYMFGTTVSSGWTKGSAITWKGEWEGKPYEDKGKILDLEPGKKLQYSHYSPMSGKPDQPENYHTVTIALSSQENATHLTLSQDGNASEKERDHSAKNWQAMLDGIKKLVEGKG